MLNNGQERRLRRAEKNSSGAAGARKMSVVQQI
jgi:hypothetical protein